MIVVLVCRSSSRLLPVQGKCVDIVQVLPCRAEGVRSKGGDGGG